MLLKKIKVAICFTVQCSEFLLSFEQNMNHIPQKIISGFNFATYLRVTRSLIIQTDRLVFFWIGLLKILNRHKEDVY